MGLLLFVLYACSHYGASAPILQPRQDQPSSWHSEPNGRGTWGLLSSCMITMGICVWSAVHLNVPGRAPQRKLERWSYWYHQLRRTRWTIMGLLAPELVVYCAWIQWSDARELSKRIRTANYSSKHHWTLSHSFFAGMGGFAVECSDFIPGRDFLYLTIAGAQRIVELGSQLPDLHEEAIEDKSKADSLGKILVCLQAGYMIFQVVGRLAAHLPITLLEVNTLGHVLCALTMYGFWFRKPLGVRDPIILAEDWGKPLMCLWFMRNDKSRSMQDDSSQMNQTQDYRELDQFYLFAHPEHRKQVEDEFYVRPGAPPKHSLQAHTQPDLLPSAEKIEAEATTHNSKISTVVNGERNKTVHAPPIVQQDLPEIFDLGLEHRILFYKHSDSSSDLKDEEILHRLQSSKLWDGLTHVFHCGGQDKFERWWVQWSTYVAPEVHELRPIGKFDTSKPVSPFTKDGATVFIPQHIFLDSAGLRRWELAYRALELDPSGEMFKGHLAYPGINKLLVTRRMKNWPSDQTGSLSRPSKPAWIMVLVTALYGALHALCWKSHFPSVAEKMLWRTSSIVIVGGPATGTIIVHGWDFVSERIDALMLETIWRFSFAITLGLCALAYVGARLFILLEAFISLRDLPTGAYQTPSWTPWLPHL